MAFPNLKSVKIAIVGLGYVGLPLATRMANHFHIVGFDVDLSRISQLQSGYDRTYECTTNELAAANLTLTSDPLHIKDADVYIVTVPTPVDTFNNPDLRAVLSASEVVGRYMKKNAIVVFESTVYPGVTETICSPALEIASGMVSGIDFYLGYSPERINPGDKVHTVDKITKVVAGQTPEVTAFLLELYGKLTNGNVFQAKDIKTAEAAKVIENAQRDINIAFVNEMAMIFSQMGIQTQDVLEAAGTKWNFLDFTPGLVGGHCIGVDPYYLAHAARELGHNPEVILAGRKINDDMAIFLAHQIDLQLKTSKVSGNSARLLVLGLTFKENVPDLRNSKVADFILALRDLGHSVDIHDPLADRDEAKAVYGFDLLENLDQAKEYEGVVGAVPHAPYLAFDASDIVRILKVGGVLADLKGMWRALELSDQFTRWEL
jgi:UDP-N-acetyl-D-galactosamine dehydrogenase